MATPEIEYTPVCAPRSKLVHAVALTEAKKTACGRPWRGWRVALRKLNCPDCQRAIGLPCRRRRRR